MCCEKYIYRDIQLLYIKYKYTLKQPIQVVRTVYAFTVEGEAEKG